MLSRFVPDRLSQWLVLLVVGGILVTQAMALALYHIDRMRAVEAAESRQAAQCLAGFAQMLGPESPDRRLSMMRPLLLGQPFGLPPGPPPDGMPSPDGRPPDGFRPPPDFLIRLPGMHPGGPPFPGPPEFLNRIEAQRILPDGTRLTLEAPQTLGSLFSGGFVAYIATIVAVGLLATGWAVSLATRPLRALSGAADRFGADVNAAPLPESGPREVRQAAAAFNRMQRRLRQFVTDRTRMLAAISHDLRTPLTRMRLRAEMIDDAEQRAKMLSDLQEMEQMVGATLAFARDDAAEEQSRRLDVRALVETIVADAVEAGQSVTLLPGEPVIAPMRPRGLKRALVNIVENAVRYGGDTEITVTRDCADAVVRVTDHGPGISEAEREAVLKPFYRCEASRSRDTGGIGLGLSIASDAISAHGGSTTLSETPGGGLTVEVRLPSIYRT